MALAIISSILDVKITLALSLTLILSATLSQILLGTASQRNIAVSIDDKSKKMTLFKGEVGSASIKIVSSRTRFVSVRVSSIRGPDGLEVTIDSEENDRITLRTMPNYAGRFSGLTAFFDLSDPLGLFQKRLTITLLDFTVDSLPKSLLLDVRDVRPISLTLGERAGKSAGYGQEFFALDEYRPSNERRAILWKRVARATDDKLVIKVRESNIPKTQKITLISWANRYSAEKLRLVDLACEGAGLIGKTLLSIGCDIELIFVKEGEVRIAHATDIFELSRSLLEMSTSDLASDDQTYSLLSESDICITGLKELEESQAFASELASKPTLLIREEGATPQRISDLSLLFSGTEDVSKLIRGVIGK